MLTVMVQVIRITDLTDPRVEAYRNVRDADLRGRDRLFMAESELVVRRLLRTPQRLHSLFLSPAKFERLSPAIDEALLAHPAAGLPIYLAEVSLMSEIAGFHIHRGALAAGFRPPPEQLTIESALGHLPGRDRFTLLLAQGITNVDNMGGLFRNAAAFGVDGVVLAPDCCDPLYRKAIRVSVGHTLCVPYANSEHWLDDLSRLAAPPSPEGNGWGVRLIGAEDDPRAVPLWQMPHASPEGVGRASGRTERVGLIVGSEHRGIDQPTRDRCDLLVRIPMAAGVPSLNVATAAAIALYERQRP